MHHLFPAMRGRARFFTTCRCCENDLLMLVAVVHTFLKTQNILPSASVVESSQDDKGIRFVL